MPSGSYRAGSPHSYFFTSPLTPADPLIPVPVRHGHNCPRGNMAETQAESQSSMGVRETAESPGRKHWPLPGWENGSFPTQSDNSEPHCPPIPNPTVQMVTTQNAL